MDPRKQPDISVLIPTHNRKELLGKTLDAYRRQSLPPLRFELLVIDDGSTDGTREMMERLSVERPGLRYVRTEHAGPARARNIGIEKARAELVFFTGDDCIPDAKLLEAHCETHAGVKGIAVLGHIAWHPDVEVSPLMRYLEKDVQFSYPAISKTGRCVPYYYFYTSNISLPKRYLSSVGGLDEDFKYAVWEDIELGYRLWKTGLRIRYEPRAKVFHHHTVTLEHYLTRQYRLGLMGALLYRKHPNLSELVPVTETVNPEIQHRFYHAVLDYYYFMGIQRGLAGEEEMPDAARGVPVIPLEERIENWNTLWLDKFHRRLLDARRRIRELEAALRDREFGLTIARKDIAAFQSGQRERERAEERERDRELAELRYFQNRVTSSLPYKAYRLLRRLLP